MAISTDVRIPSWLAVGGVLGLAAAVRLAPLLGTDFPLHDGGFFAVMASEIRDSGFRVPLETSYNQAHIPFAYPPLGLFAAAVGLNWLDVTTVFRLLPLLYSVGTVAAVYWLMRGLMSQLHATVASGAFALMPLSFAWLILGGGVTRGLGLILALAVVGVTVRYVARPRWSLVLAIGLLGGMTVMTHPEASLFAVLSVGVIAAFRGRAIHAWRGLVVAGGIAALVASPWLVAMLLRYGPGLLLDAAATRSDGQGAQLLRLLNLDVTGAPVLLLDVFLFMAIVGVVRDARRGSWFLLAWFLAVSLLMPGAGATYATVPLAGACAVGLVDVVLPLAKSRPRMVAAFVGFAWAAALFGALVIGWNPYLPVDEIPTSDRILMEQVHDSDIDQYAVLTGRAWYGEGPSEWGAAITGAEDVALVQGSEWLGDEVWDSRRELNRELQTCARTSAACLVRWMDENQISVVLVSAVIEDDSVFRADLLRNDRLRVIAAEGYSLLVALLPADPPTALATRSASSIE